MIIIMCGEDTVLFDDILVVDSWSQSIKPSDSRPEFIRPGQRRIFVIGNIFNPMPIRRTMILRKVWHHPNSETIAGSTLGLTVLDLGRILKATDPRDKVYGFLG
jgi:hypothetical protein